VNEVDAEAIPQLDPAFGILNVLMNSTCASPSNPFSSLITGSFIFLTSAPGIDHPDLGFLLICSCRACEEPTGCECQEASEFVDEMGRPMHAYTETVSNKSCDFLLSLTRNLNLDCPP
jgi:hypothetical protein